MIALLFHFSILDRVQALPSLPPTVQGEKEAEMILTIFVLLCKIFALFLQISYTLKSYQTPARDDSTHTTLI